MAKLNILHRHSLPVDVARQRVTEIFEIYKDKYGISSRWDGDKMLLTGSGFNGDVRITAEEVEVDAKLGFTVSLIKGKIESTIRKEFEEKLTA